MSHPDDDLLERLLAQQLAEDAIRDLNARLAVDADLRRRLIHLADEHASLRQALVLNPVRLGRRPLAARRPLLVRRSLLVRVSAAALLVLGIAAGSWWWRCCCCSSAPRQDYNRLLYVFDTFFDVCALAAPRLVQKGPLSTLHWPQANVVLIVAW